MTLNLTRQNLIIPAPELFSPLIIGAGGIGSNVAHILSSMGISSVIFDFDVVGDENISPQFYLKEEIGKPKASTLSNRLNKMYDVNNIGIDERYENQIVEADVVILGLDSLKARKDVLDGISFPFTYLIDGRMGGVTCAIYGFTNLYNLELRKFENGLRGQLVEKEAEELQQKTLNKLKLYTEGLESKEAVLPCGLKSTAFFTKGILSGMIASYLLRIQRYEDIPELWYLDLEDCNEYFKI